MNYERILVPTDFSPSAREAADFASLLAHERGAGIVYLHVEAVPDIPGADFDVADLNESALRRRLEEIRPHIGGVPFEHQLIKGHPSDAILRAAEKEQADLVVMGMHGQSDAPGSLMGAVARSVVERSPRPVLLIKLPSHVVAAVEQ